MQRIPIPSTTLVMRQYAACKNELPQVFRMNTLINPELPNKKGQRLQWGQIYGSADALLIAEAARQSDSLLLVITQDVQNANTLKDNLEFFLSDANIPVLQLPDWETLPYDSFSPLPELISERLRTLSLLPRLKHGVLVVPVATAMQRLCPADFIEQQALVLKIGDELHLETMRERLTSNGYQHVTQVVTYGEFTIRGSLFDIYPMGSEQPYRIDLFDDEIDSIRIFDPESQHTINKTDHIELLPAHEFPSDKQAISLFRQNYRDSFEHDPKLSLIYNDVSDGQFPSGIEYYLPLFFTETASIFDYLPDNTLCLFHDTLADDAATFMQQVENRYEQRRHDIERPLLAPEKLYLGAEELVAASKSYASVRIENNEIASRSKGYADFVNFGFAVVPALSFQARATSPAGQLKSFMQSQPGRVLFVAESTGRRQHLLDTLRGFSIQPHTAEGWSDFLASKHDVCLSIAPLEQAIWSPAHHTVIITESQLLGERVKQRRRKRVRDADPEQIIRNLTELSVGSPVVHEEHGIGRYLGLQKLDVGGIETEFLTLEYAKGDKLYVPVSSIQLISRYSGASPEHAPMHKLGGEQWAKARKKAAEKAYDAAAELLDIYARREAHPGQQYKIDEEAYRQFSSTFEFEETEDQQTAIDSVIADMASTRPMDRVVCGDVGFGKTEVAMRAAFVAANCGKQVAVLVPTTLLAQQHYENFLDRFSEWPLKIESLSRFRSAKDTKGVIQGLKSGSVDIVIGTHKIFSKDVSFKDLGLVIIDEEHRFGVRHKEKLKSMRSEVDILTLTATPIPRTLNMAMSGMRDLSIIATPPAARHPIKTFVTPWNDELIIEAVQRELKRGGQCYFLHNEVSTIENMADKLLDLIPEARIRVAHGQMREAELEAIMRDFYHQRFNILVCTTIVESGIDVATANTIIMNRADKLGLAQLHQLRGRVGRSHHRAYAYLITPPKKVMTSSARKRLEAIESMENLGAGFTLSTHDLEIRGAGELLGEGQSGQIQEVGFAMYNELLERAVRALKSGEQPNTSLSAHSCEVDLKLPTILPDDYVPDIHTRLVMYKRIANANSNDELKDLKIELIDRFGLLPDQTNYLFDTATIKLQAKQFGIKRIEAGPTSGRIQLDEKSSIDPMKLITLIQSKPNRFKPDGGDKLKFFGDFSALETRVDKIQSILHEVTH